VENFSREWGVVSEVVLEAHLDVNIDHHVTPALLDAIVEQRVELLVFRDHFIADLDLLKVNLRIHGLLPYVVEP
jgi:hypothetical protein